MEPLSAVCAWDETAVKVKVTLVMISHEQADSLTVELSASTEWDIILLIAQCD